MTDKPDNQMEQWLEEYAQRRRGELGGPIEMHEATRTMLQGKVSRKYGQPAEPQSKPQGFRWIGWALGATAVGAVALVISTVPNQPTQPGSPGRVEMAKADPKPNPGTVVEPEGAARDQGQFKMAVAKEAGENKNLGQAKSMAEGQAPQGFGAARSAPGSPGIATDLLGGARTSAHRSAPGSSGIAAGQGSPGVAPQAGTVHPVTHPAFVQPSVVFFNNLRELRQEFEQADVDIANRKNALPKPVLVKFQIERTGNQIRVLDGDGSIYTGIVINEEEFAADAVEPADKFNETVGLAAPTSPKIAGAPALAVRRVTTQAVRVPRGQFYFRVSGINKTLRKRVDIEATFDHQMEKLATTKSKAGQNKNRPLAGVAKKDLKSRNIQAVRAIARMRVLGNARIEKANYRIDAYQRAPAVPAAPIPAKPTEAKEK